MKGERLELEVWEQLRSAQLCPEAIDVAEILDALEAVAGQLPEAKRLHFAGEALLRVAEVCAARAGVLMNQWKEGYRDPRVERGFFEDVVRQTMCMGKMGRCAIASRFGGQRPRESRRRDLFRCRRS